MSAKTPALSTTKHPLGKPGGPGLYHIKGDSLDPYIENIAAKLMKVNPAWDKSHAIAVAINMVKRLAATSKHPEVKAAAAKALASLAKSRAKAAAQPNLSNAVELAIQNYGQMSNDDLIRAYTQMHGKPPTQKQIDALRKKRKEPYKGLSRIASQIKSLPSKSGDADATSEQKQKLRDLDKIDHANKHAKKTGQKLSAHHSLAHHWKHGWIWVGPGEAPGKGKTNLSNTVDPAVLTIHRKLCAAGVKPEHAMKMAIKARNKKRRAKGKADMANEQHQTEAHSKSASQKRTAGAAIVRSRHPKGSARGGQFMASGAGRQ